MELSQVAARERQSGRFKLYSLEELEQLPAPSWLVDRILGTRTVNVLFGPSNEGKTFTSLDLALSIATGKAWHGHRVKKGEVIYIAGEGASAIRLRARAWERHHGEDAGRLFMVRNAVQLRNAAECSEFAFEVKSAGAKPSLVIIDTMARAFVGGDENSSKEVGEFVESARRLQEMLDCTVLIVHHSGKRKGKRDPGERGSSALRGAADTMIRVFKQGEVVRFECDKQKDAEPFKPMAFRLHTIHNVGFDEDGNPLDSCVVIPEEASPRTASMDRKREAALVVLAATAGGKAKFGEWWQKTEAYLNERIAERTFHDIHGDLEELQQVIRVARGVYEITPAGSATAADLQKTAAGERATAAATAPTPVGGAVQHAPAERIQ